MTALTPARRSGLRARAHNLQAAVSISRKGLTESVLKEIDSTLKAHELIKVRLYGIEREQRDALLAEIATRLTCAPVQHIGNVLVLWRENPAPPVDKPAAAKQPTRSAGKRVGGKPR